MSDDPTPNAQHPYRDGPPLPLPARPILVLLIVGAVGCAALGVFTWHKLETARRLRGELPGIPERTLVFASEIRRYSAWQAQYRLIDDTAPGSSWTIQLTDRQIERGNYRYGDPIRVRCLPGDRECFIHDSIFINDGNMGFDRGLVRIELAGFLAFAAIAVRRWARWRGAVRAVQGRSRRRSS